jgi:hypothetical protein
MKVCVLSMTPTLPLVPSLRSLREEMKAVARGERPAPADAGKPTFNSVEAVVRLLTPQQPTLPS